MLFTCFDTGFVNIVAMENIKCLFFGRHKTCLGICVFLDKYYPRNTLQANNLSMFFYTRKWLGNLLPMLFCVTTFWVSC